MTSHSNRISRLAADEAGGITVLSLFLFIGMLLVTGLAVDRSNAVRTRADLQMAADMAGHAALVTVQGSDHADARAAAIEYARRNAPPTVRKDVLDGTMIEFGNWNGESRTFTPSATSRAAVRATARMDKSQNNGMRTFLMKMIGIDQLEITTSSIWVNAPAPCINGGFTANGKVDMRSGNAYDRGFCIHSNTHVEFQQNNEFIEGSVVSMPVPENLVIPASGMARNEGLAEALRPGTKDLSLIFDTLEATMEAYKDPFYSGQPAYITIGTANEITMGNGGAEKGKKAAAEEDLVTAALKMSDLQSYAVNIVDCGGKTLTIDNDEVIRDVVLVTDCEVKFNSGSALEDAILVVTNTGSKSVSAPSGLRLGVDDDCRPGGGATILTLGDVTVAAGLEVYGGQIVAMGDIGFTAQANGLEGVSFIANGEIDGTSEGRMGFCPGSGTDFEIEVYETRMVL